MFQLLRRFRDDDGGAAMVELAIVTAVILIPMVFGVIEFGRAVWVKTTLTTAAREGVRYAIVRGTDSGMPADSAAVANYVKGKTQLTGIKVSPTWNPNKNPFSTVQVQVTYNYVPIVPLLSARVITSTSKQIIAF